MSAICTKNLFFFFFFFGGGGGCQGQGGLRNEEPDGEALSSPRGLLHNRTNGKHEFLCYLKEGS